MRIPMHDTSQSYGAVSVCLHWMTALLVLLLLTSAVIMAIWLPDRSAPDLATPLGPLDRRSIILIHEALGVVLIPVTVARIAWRLFSRKPQSLVSVKSLRIAAEITWRLLLLGLVVQLLSGTLALLFYGYPLQIFNLTLFSLPTAESAAGHEVAELVHFYTGWSIASFVALHVSGTLYHALFERDGTLRRICFAGHEPQSWAESIADERPLAENVGAGDDPIENAR